MASNFTRYYHQLSRAQELVSDREGRVHSIVYQVLDGLEFNTERIGIQALSINDNRVYIQYGLSSRGLHDSSDVTRLCTKRVTLPLSLFTADDPKVAAQEYRKAQLAEEAKVERRCKERELERLQKELAGGN